MTNYSIEIGPHRFGFAPPHTVHLQFTDDIEEGHAREVIQQCGRHTAGNPFVILLHTPEMKSVTPKARKVFADGFKEMPFVAAAFVSASIRTRAIATFVVTAINVFRERKLAVAFFDADAEAEAWAADELRRWNTQ